jgi:SprT protein
MTSQELHELVIGCAGETWSQFRRAFPQISPDVPLIRYNKRLKTTAGRAFLTKNYIDLSNEMLWQHGEKFIAEIVPHELGHMVAYKVFKDEGHGQGWHFVMQVLGIPYSRTHTFINDLHEHRKLVRMAR